MSLKRAVETTDFADCADARWAWRLDGATPDLSGAHPYGLHLGSAFKITQDGEQTNRLLRVDYFQHQVH